VYLSVPGNLKGEATTPPPYSNGSIQSNALTKMGKWTKPNADKPAAARTATKQMSNQQRAQQAAGRQNCCPRQHRSDNAAVAFGSCARHRRPVAGWLAHAAGMRTFAAVYQSTQHSGAYEDGSRWHLTLALTNLGVRVPILLRILQLQTESDRTQL